MSASHPLHPRGRAPRAATAPARPGPLRRWLLAGTVALIVYGTLFPFTGWRLPAHGWWSIPVTAYAHAARSDMLANVLMYVPPGFLLALRRRLRAVPWIALAALVLSVGLETAQAFLPGRVSSLLDVATNTLGAAIGALVATALHWPRHAPVQRSALLRNDRAAHVALAALAAWACAQLIPFVPSLDPAGVWHALAPVRETLEGARPLSAWRCTVYVAGISALTVAGADALGGTRWRWAVALFLLAVVPLRALMLGRELSPEALLGTFVGVLLGLALLAARGSRARGAAMVLLVIYALGNAWQPGPPGTVIHPFNWIPLAAELNNPVNAMANFADATWPVLALACLCLRAGLRTLWPLLPLLALVLFGIQLGQHLVPGRYPGITMALVGTVAWALAALHVGHGGEPRPRARDE